MTSTSELIERLKAAERGSRELDEMFSEAMGVPVERFDIGADHPLAGELQGGLHFAVHPDGTRTAVSPCTTSLDAITSLIESVLPGFHWDIGNSIGGDAMLMKLDGPGDEAYHGAEAKTPALALCIALLQAVEARGE